MWECQRIKDPHHHPYGLLQPLPIPATIVGPDDVIKLVDFDWSGKQGEVVYPPFQNPKVEWHPDLRVSVKIQKEHDLHLLKHL